MSKGQSTQGGAARTPDEIECKIYGGEYARDVTLRQLYGDLSLDEIKRIPKFKRDNHALFGLLVTAEVVTHKEGRGLIHQAMVDNYLRDFPLIRFYDACRKKSPARVQPDNAELLAAIQKAISDIQADTTAAALNAATISNGVDFLVKDRKGKIKANSQRGKDSQRKGDHEEAVRAARDMADALKKIAADPDVKAGKHGSVLAACRKLCDWELNGVKHHGRFRPLTSKRNADGSFAEYAPLTDKSGKPIKPETLARQFRDSRGTRKERAKK